MGRIKRYRMTPISKKFSEKGGFTAQFVGDGYSVDAEKEILPRIIEATGIRIGNGAAWDLINSFVKACAKHTSETGETVTVGGLMTFGLAIRGWYSYQDSKADRDNVRVTATLLGDLKPAIDFGMSNIQDGVKLRANTVRGVGCALGHVKGGEAFQLNGVGLNLIEGDTVTATAVTSKGDTIEGACTVTSAEEDRLDAILPAEFAVPALVGRNVTIAVVSHCGDATATPAEKTITATIDASTAPAPIAQTSDGKCKITSIDDEGSTTDFLYGSAWDVNGTGIYGDRAAPGGEWEIARCSVSVDGSDYTLAGNFNEDGTHGEISPLGGDTPAKGTYHDVELSLVATRGTESETLTITLPTFIVE